MGSSWGSAHKLHMTPVWWPHTYISHIGPYDIAIWVIFTASSHLSDANLAETIVLCGMMSEI